MLILTYKITPASTKPGLKCSSHILVATASAVTCRMLTDYLLATNTLKRFWVKLSSSAKHQASRTARRGQIRETQTVFLLCLYWPPTKQWEGECSLSLSVSVKASYETVLCDCWDAFSTLLNIKMLYKKFTCMDSKEQVFWKHWRVYILP